MSIRDFYNPVGHYMRGWSQDVSPEGVATAERLEFHLIEAQDGEIEGTRTYRMKCGRVYGETETVPAPDHPEIPTCAGCSG